jgi:hypothetical protein
VTVLACAEASATEGPDAGILHVRVCAGGRRVTGVPTAETAPGGQMSENVIIEIVEGDALEINADVLALKYGQEYYGVDELVSERLARQGIDQSRMQPRPGGFRLVPSSAAIGARNVLFVGVVDLYDFGYREIRDFGRRVLSALAGAAPQTRHVAARVHGAGYGLEEIEAFEAELAGFLDAIGSGDIPKSLEKISVVECNPGRVARSALY